MSAECEEGRCRLATRQTAFKAMRAETKQRKLKKQQEAEAKAEALRQERLEAERKAEEEALAAK